MFRVQNITRLALIACRRLVWGWHRNLWLSAPELAAEECPEERTGREWENTIRERKKQEINDEKQG